MMMIRLAALTVLAAACGGEALAQDDDDDDARRPRFEIAAGAFFADSDAELRVDSATLGRGTTIDLEQDLGFDADQSAARAAAIWRFGERRRHRIDAGYFALDRTARRVIDEEIRFEDEVFEVSADIRAEFNVDIFKIDYTYMFIQSENAELGGSIGIFGIGTRASLSEASLGESESSDVTFPLPTLGVRGDVGIWRQLSLKGSADVFFIETGDYSGELYDLIAALELDIFEHLGLGVGYNYADLNLGASRSEGDVDLNLGYEGPFAYVRVMF